MQNDYQLLRKCIFILFFSLIFSTNYVQSKAVFYNQQGYEKYESGNYHAAINDYSQAIGLDSTSAKVYYNRGVCKARLGYFEPAIKDYESAITLDDNYVAAYFEKAYALYKLQHFQQSINVYTKTIEKDLRHRLAYLNRGVVRYILDYVNNACLDWLKAKSMFVTEAEQYLSEYCKNRPRN